jgi:hypothetical protein
MAPRAVQLSLIETPRVVLEYDPRRQPPDATGPDEWGSYTAALASCPLLSGEGSTERLALTALAMRLTDYVGAQPAPGELSATGQALVAAERLPRDEVVRWLEQQADDPVLHSMATLG